MGLCEALDGSFKYTSSCFIKMCICRDVLKGANKIFIWMLLCDKSRRGASSAAGGHLQSWPRRRQPGSCRAPGGSLGRVALDATRSGDASHVQWLWHSPACRNPSLCLAPERSVPNGAAAPFPCVISRLPCGFSCDLAAPPSGVTARSRAAGAAQCAWAGAGSGGGWRGESWESPGSTGWLVRPWHLILGDLQEALAPQRL